MVNVLWERGDAAASMNLEDLFDQLARKHDIAIFCSFLMDNFNGGVHAHMLPRLGTNHSHLIPVEDYVRLERAVADALRETVGPDEARVLEGRLLADYRPAFDMPRAQALLLALRQVLPTVADPVLERSRRLYTAPGAAQPAGLDLIRILDTVELPIVVVGSDQTITCFNEAAANVLGLSRSDLGGALCDVTVLAGFPRLERDCGQVIAGGVESCVDVRDGETRFVVRISPYTIADRRVIGAVLTFTNVTAFRASMDQAIYERESTKAILNTVADPLVVLSESRRIQSANRAFYAMFGVSREQTQGIPLHDLGNGIFAETGLRAQLEELLTGDPTGQPLEVERVVTPRGQRTLLL